MNKKQLDGILSSLISATMIHCKLKTAMDLIPEMFVNVNMNNLGEELINTGKLIGKLRKEILEEFKDD